jgi:hypothetical protein
MHFLAGLFILAGFWVLFGAKSAIHEIEACIFWLIAAVLSGSAAVRSAIQTLHQDFIRREPEEKQGRGNVLLDFSPANQPSKSLQDWFFHIVIAVLLLAAIILLLEKDRVSKGLREWFAPAELHMK